MDMRGTGREEDSASGHAEGCVEAAASEVICISFTPSREYADAIRHDRNVRDGKACGATAGDTWHLGLRTYDVIDPFARYRDDKREPMDNPFWRARIEKHKRLREADNAMWAIRDASEAITDDEFDVWFNTITKG